MSTVSNVTVEDACMGLAAELERPVHLNDDPVMLKQRVEEAGALMAVLRAAHDRFKSMIAQEIRRQVIARQDLLQEAGLSSAGVAADEEAKPKTRGRPKKSEEKVADDVSSQEARARPHSEPRDGDGGVETIDAVSFDA